MSATKLLACLLALLVAWTPPVSSAADPCDGAQEIERSAYFIRCPPNSSAIGSDLGHLDGLWRGCACRQGFQWERVDVVLSACTPCDGHQGSSPEIEEEERRRLPPWWRAIGLPTPEWIREHLAGSLTLLVLPVMLRMGMVFILQKLFTKLTGYEWSGIAAVLMSGAYERNRKYLTGMVAEVHPVMGPSRIEELTLEHIDMHKQYVAGQMQVDEPETPLLAGCDQTQIFKKIAPLDPDVVWMTFMQYSAALGLDALLAAASFVGHFLVYHSLQVFGFFTTYLGYADMLHPITQALALFMAMREVCYLAAVMVACYQKPAALLFNPFCPSVRLVDALSYVLQPDKWVVKTMVTLSQPKPRIYVPLLVFSFLADVAGLIVLITLLYEHGMSEQYAPLYGCLGFAAAGLLPFTVGALGNYFTEVKENPLQGDIDSFRARSFVKNRRGVNQARREGLSVRQITVAVREEGVADGGLYGATEFKAAGFTAAELKEGGFPLADLKAAGFTAADLKAAGFTAAELKAHGFTAADLKAADFTARDLKAGGFIAAELKAAGFNAAELKEGDFPLAALKAAGFTVADLRAAEFPYAELEKVGFTATELEADAVAVLLDMSATPAALERAAASLKPADLDGWKKIEEKIGARPEALRGLVRLLGVAAAPAAQEFAAFVLRALTFETAENSKRIGAAPEALQGLVGLLGAAAAPAAQVQAVGALNNLAADAAENTRRIGATPGALEGLVGLLGAAAAPAVQEQAAAALRTLARDDAESRKRIVAVPGALQGLVGLLGAAAAPAAQEFAAGALCALAYGDAENRKAIGAAPGALQGLVGLLGAAVAPAAHAHAVAALGTLASDAENRKAIRAVPGALQGLEALQGDASPAVRELAAAALRNVNAWW